MKLKIMMLITGILFYFSLGHAENDYSCKYSSVVFNNEYISYIDSESKMHFYDCNKNNSHDLNVKYKIKALEMCSKYPFISYIGYTDNPQDEEHYFTYDIEDRKLHEMSDTQMHWSLSGNYTYYLDRNHESLILIKTQLLRPFLKNRNSSVHQITIKGIPLGFIRPILWVGDNLIYANEFEETSECWGVYNSGKEENYLIGCCGHNTDLACNNELKKDQNIIKAYISKAEKYQLKKINNDFFSEIKRLKVFNTKSK